MLSVDLFTFWFEQHAEMHVPLLPLLPLHRRRIDGPHSYAAFLARGSATSKLFNMRADRGGGGGRGGGRGGPFQGRNFSVGSLEESIPPSWPSARVHPCLCPICVGFLVCSINDFSLGMKFSIFFLFQNPPTEFVSRMLFGTHRTPRQIDAPPLRLILGGGRGNHCAAVSCCQQSVDYRPQMTENE